MQSFLRNHLDVYELTKSSEIVFFVVVLVAVLGFKLRALCLQVIYHLTNTPTPFILGIFRMGYPIYTQVSLDCSPLTYTSCVAEMTVITPRFYCMR
jgi:hypothetical protein